MGLIDIKTGLGDKQYAEFVRLLTLLKEQLMATEEQVTKAVKDAADGATANIAAALTKEKQEIIDAIKANPPAGITEAGLANILSMVAGIGSSSVAGIDKLSVDVSTPPAPAPPTP